MRLKHFIKIALAVVALAQCLAVSCAKAPTETQPIARGGLADLAGVNVDEPVALDGGWEFYWSRFVDPTAFEGEDHPLCDAIVPYPSEWTDYRIAGVGSTGYCTWKLRIVGLAPGGLYGVKASSFLSAASVYANGALVQSFGTPGRSASEEEPRWSSVVVPLIAGPDGRIDIVIHASNFFDREGGSRSSILLGTLGAVSAKRESAVAYELFVVGALWVMGAYYLGLFAFRRKERAALWFGLLCAALGFRVLCYDEYYLLAFFPGMPWRLLFSLGYFTFTAAVALFAAFIRTSFPEEFPRWGAITALVCSLAYSLVVVASTSIAARYLVAYQGVTVLIGVGSMAAIVAAAIKKRPGARMFGIGFLLIFGSAVYDMLVSADVLHGVFIAQIGMLGFLFALSLTMTKRYAGAFLMAERMSGNLARVNKSLERFVPKEFLGFLKKSTIEDIALGDSSAETMAVLFVDVRSFTSFAESSTPEETFAFINEYLARVGPAVRAHGGFIDKYLGDGFMALFPDGAEPAVRCAIDIQERVAAYNDERVATGRRAIQIGIGLHEGGLMLGTIGEEQRMDGTVISDAVNLASRLEGVSKEYGLCVAASERILAGLPDPTAHRMRFIGKIRVRGKREPVSVFEIYDGDPPSLRAKKDSIRSAFERGVEAYYKKRFADARVLFAQVLAVLPDDGAALRYMQSMENSAAKDCPPD